MIMKSMTLIIIFVIGLKAQDLTHSDFVETRWFANNDKRNFYESDTISLIRILKFNSEHEKLNELGIKLHWNNNRDITKLEFRTKKKLGVRDLFVKSWTGTLYDENWEWLFDSNKQIINLYFKQKIHSSFQINSKKNDHIIWKSGDKNKETESKLDLLVLNLIRLKTLQ